mmetsp:Transcript_6058/g.18284  ORF Transcript_6058/g.18284 Transcript_6058/m.18284 type:complete len:202 (-) Transcript_6058:205-810(-)
MSASLTPHGREKGWLLLWNRWRAGTGRTSHGGRKRAPAPAPCKTRRPGAESGPRSSASERNACTGAAKPRGAQSPRGPNAGKTGAGTREGYSLSMMNCSICPRSLASKWSILRPLLKRMKVGRLRTWSWFRTMSGNFSASIMRKVTRGCFWQMSMYSDLTRWYEMDREEHAASTTRRLVFRRGLLLLDSSTMSDGRSRIFE